MAKYEMQETPDLHKTGKKVLYPKLVLNGQVQTDELIRKMSNGSSFTEGDIKGMMRRLADKLAELMAEGNSVKLEGIGTFSASLALKDGKEQETSESEERHNARSIQVGGVNFRADKQLVMDTNKLCHLERSEKKFLHSSRKYTPEERLQLARKYLEENPFLTVAKYSRLTGLVGTTAGLELKKWSKQEGSGIGTAGRAAHRIYIKA